LPLATLYSTNCWY